MGRIKPATATNGNPFDKYQDFGHSHFHDSLMWGENIENFAIIGGKINGGSIGHGDPKPGGGDKLITIPVKLDKQPKKETPQ